MASVTKTAGSVTNNQTSGDGHWQKSSWGGGGDPPADFGLSYLELLSDDNEYALWLGGDVSHYLQCTQFDFSSIPDGAQINGVELNFKRLNTGSADVFDLTIKLVKNGTISGDNKSVGATWSVTEQTVTFGGSTDTWGLSLTAADVKASNFGVVIQAEKDIVFGDPEPNAGIDYLTLTVHYDGPTSTNNSCNFSITGSFSGNPNDYLDFFTHGKISVDSTPLNLYTRGTLNGENFETLPFYTLNTVPSNSNFTFYIDGETSVDAGIRLFTHGKSVLNNNLPFFISQYPPPSPGASASINMFLRALTQDEAFPPSSGNTTGTVNFVIYRPDAYDFSVLNDNPASPLSSMNLYLKGASSAPTTSNLNLFIKNIPFSVSEGISLFLYNSIEPYFNNLPLFTKGLGLSGSEDDVEGSEGYTPFGGSMNLFIQRNTPGSINLYLQGPAQPTNDSLPFYIDSKLTSNSNITLVIPNSIGIPNSVIKFFSTGF